MDAVQSTRLGSSYSVSGTNISVDTLGGLTTGSATHYTDLKVGYDVNTAGDDFSFSENAFVGDTPVTSQTSLSGGLVAAPNIYGSTTQSQGGTAGSLAGTLSATGVPTVQR